ncbi:MAG: hypothetical protein LBK44_03840 [Spirochaetales bacterium]|jgi:hypothetical protein|nr:hypothetical protein [Spirochaetales bacterium]
MEIKKLTEKEFKATFSEKMNDVTDNADAVVDIWKYVEALEPSKYFINDYIIEKKLVEKVYRNSINTYDQILIPTIKKNVYLIIIADIKKENICGHYLLDLNKEYGVSK